MEQSVGSNLLLRDGAVPVIDHTDVINYYIHQLDGKITNDIELDINELPKENKDTQSNQLKDFRRIAQKHLNFEQKLVFECIGLIEMDIEAIIEQTGLPVSTVMTALTELESLGVIVSCPGNTYKISI